MESFTFHNPTKIMFGKNQTTHLGAQMHKDGIQKCILIAGKGSIRKNGAYDQVIDSLEKAGIKYTESWGVEANPRLPKTCEIIAHAKEYGAQAVLAVGGGSVIDTAKAVAAGLYLKDIWNAFIRKEMIKQALPIYTVLTVSGSGSEMNSEAMITNIDTCQKWSVSSPFIYPRLSIIDPSFQNTLPFKQTANGAMDAISHILEFYFANEKPITTLTINEALLRTITEMTDLLQKDPRDYNARANLAWGSTLALNGLSGVGMKGGDWSCHDIDHAFSALHPEISHGEGLAAILPAWIEYLSEREPSRFLRWAKCVWNEDNVSLAVRAFRSKLQSWGLATSLRDLSIKPDELDQILEMIMVTPTIGGIFKLSKDDVRSLLMLAY
ncbi:MAG: iron-containing alcohol dehydrogenase [Candidatus Cloacimonetes bacterium]|jgi:alcohol dehydrogenase YqhD (iron-dependent ADH family)|nr:iron-containing alcohol dehydrogenase [Candidatus Cloacimonadota bacterium]MDY0171376.1 iron-containing alcohol dehydrogenase [Candidatus Cloacimonadaceae bacterium]